MKRRLIKLIRDIRNGDFHGNTDAMVVSLFDTIAECKGTFDTTDYNIINKVIAKTIIIDKLEKNEFGEVRKLIDGISFFNNYEYLYVDDKHGYRDLTEEDILNVIHDLIEKEELIDNLYNTLEITSFLAIEAFTHCNKIPTCVSGKFQI